MANWRPVGDTGNQNAGELSGSSDYLLNQDRIVAHIMSDKIIYKPNDLAFFEVILVDVLTKKPYKKPILEI